jgi:hypothetical protein
MASLDRPGSVADSASAQLELRDEMVTDTLFGS